MKLLLDQNVSPRLVARLAGLYPGSAHVQDLGLATASDDDIWDHARDNDFVIVTKDSDFGDLGVIRGFPPKVLWLQLGNCANAQVEAALRDNFADIDSFGNDPAVGLLVLA
jgi:predicted nuclease of predicted toxin-antitoxin system